jgi:hypothetical protein
MSIDSQEELRGKRVVIDPMHLPDPTLLDKPFTIGGVTQPKKKGPDGEKVPVGPRLLTLIGDDGEVVEFIPEENTRAAPAPRGPRPRAAVITEEQEHHHMSADPIVSLNNRIASDAKARHISVAEHVTSLSKDDLKDYLEHFDVGGVGSAEPAAEPVAASDVAALRSVVALLQQPDMTPEKAVVLLRAQFGSAPTGAQHTAAQSLFLSAVKAIAARDRIDLAAATTKACDERPDLYKAAYPEHAEAR